MIIKISVCKKKTTKQKQWKQVKIRSDQNFYNLTSSSNGNNMSWLIRRKKNQPWQILDSNNGKIDGNPPWKHITGLGKQRVASIIIIIIIIIHQLVRHRLHPPCPSRLLYCPTSITSHLITGLMEELFFGNWPPRIFIITGTTVKKKSRSFWKRQQKKSRFDGHSFLVYLCPLCDSSWCVCFPLINSLPKTINITFSQVDGMSGDSCVTV